MAPAAQPAAAQPKKDIADYFRPYAKMPKSPPPIIPAKRPSPASSDESEGGPERQRKIEPPRTPSHTRHIQAVISPFKSPFAPGSGASVKISLRSPKPPPAHPGPLNLDSLSPYKTSPLSSIHQTPTQVPKPLSFVEAPASIQSVFHDGERVAVLDSDDDDNESLMSLSDLFQRKRGEATDSSSPPDVDEKGLEKAREESLSLFTNGRSRPIVGRDDLRELASKAKVFDVDVRQLLADHNLNQEIEENVKKAKEGYQASEEKARQRRKEVDGKSLLASFAPKKGSSAQLLQAVARLEALSTVPTWSLFESRAPFAANSSWRAPLDGFETASPWIECLRDPATKSRLLASGYLTSLIVEEITPATTSWAQTCFSLEEPRGELRQACIDLAAAESSKWSSAMPSLASVIEKAFEDLGADPEKTKCSDKIMPEDPAASNHQQREPRLLCLVETLVTVSSRLDTQALHRFTQLLMRLAIDYGLMQILTICLAVENAITRLVTCESISQSVMNCVLTDMGNVKDAHLQAQVLLHIIPLSSTIAALRVRLATKFLLGPDKDVGSQDGQLLIDLDVLTLWLESVRVDITRPGKQHQQQYDYNRLWALIQIFDVALADGGRPLVVTQPNQESSFNASIDLLADRIQAITSAIPDSGTTHLRRSQTKESLRAIRTRLQYAVRTKPPPMRNVFASRDDQKERSAAAMKDFLAKK